MTKERIRKIKKRTSKDSRKREKRKGKETSPEES